MSPAPGRPHGSRGSTDMNDPRQGTMRLGDTSRGPVTDFSIARTPEAERWLSFAGPGGVP